MATSVSDIMSKKLESILGSDSVREAAKQMRNRNVSSLVVVDKETSDPVGILTERDLVHRVCAAGVDANNVQVNQVLSSPLVSIDPKSSIEVAAEVMSSNKVRHLLVLDSNRKPLGILTPSDFIKYLRNLVDFDEVNARILESLREAES
jgi:CBS domain-containing protein